MSNDNRKYNTTLTALWSTKKGHAMSMKIDARNYDKIKAALEEVEIGGKFIVKALTEETRGKFQDPEKAPNFFLEYIPKGEVERFEAENPRQAKREDVL